MAGSPRRWIVIRSPVNGTVGNMAVEQKTTIAANALLLMVVDLRALEVGVHDRESYADALGLGMPGETIFASSIYLSVANREGGGLEVSFWLPAKRE